jgi:hypothetical protein
MAQNLKFPNELLQQVASDLKEYHQKANVATLEVTVHDGGKNQYTFSLPQFLDMVSNDLYWDERGNWADFRLARVESF